MNTKEAAYKEAFLKSLFQRGAAKAAPRIGEVNLASSIASTKRDGLGFLGGLKNNLLPKTTVSPGKQRMYQTIVNDTERTVKATNPKPPVAPPEPTPAPPSPSVSPPVKPPDTLTTPSTKPTRNKWVKRFGPGAGIGAAGLGVGFAMGSGSPDPQQQPGGYQ